MTLMLGRLATGPGDERHTTNKNTTIKDTTVKDTTVKHTTVKHTTVKCTTIKHMNVKHTTIKHMTSTDWLQMLKGWGNTTDSIQCPESWPGGYCEVKVLSNGYCEVSPCWSGYCEGKVLLSESVNIEWIL